jgi:hypothetical protein
MSLISAVRVRRQERIARSIIISNILIKNPSPPITKERGLIKEDHKRKDTYVEMDEI